MERTPTTDLLLLKSLGADSLLETVPLTLTLIKSHQIKAVLYCTKFPVRQWGQTHTHLPKVSSDRFDLEISTSKSLQMPMPENNGNQYVPSAVIPSLVLRTFGSLKIHLKIYSMLRDNLEPTSTRARGLGNERHSYIFPHCH